MVVRLQGQRPDVAWGRRQRVQRPARRRHVVAVDVDDPGWLVGGVADFHALQAVGDPQAVRLEVGFLPRPQPEERLHLLRRIQRPQRRRLARAKYRSAMPSRSASGRTRTRSRSTPISHRAVTANRAKPCECDTLKHSGGGSGPASRGLPRDVTEKQSRRGSRPKQSPSRRRSRARATMNSSRARTATGRKRPARSRSSSERKPDSMATSSAGRSRAAHQTWTSPAAGVSRAGAVGQSWRDALTSTAPAEFSATRAVQPAPPSQSRFGRGR